jgi:isoleucyl-tRNA synthetase
MGAALACRDQANIGVRWPLKEIIISTKDEKVQKACEELEDLIKSQVNVKNITFGDVELNYEIKPNYQALGKKFGEKTPRVAELIKNNTEKIKKNIDKVKLEVFEITREDLDVKKIVPEKYRMSEFLQTMVFLNTETTPELEQEGFVREIMRRTQSLRKKANLNKQDVIEMVVEKKEKWLEEYASEIKAKVGAKTMAVTAAASKKYAFDSKESIKGKEFRILLNKL